MPTTPTEAPRTGHVTLKREPVIGVPETHRQYVSGELWRTGFATLMGAFMLWGTAVEGSSAGYRLWTPTVWLDIVLGVVAIGLLHFRHRWPLAVVVVTALFGMVSVTSTWANVLALTSMATRRRWLEIALGMVLPVASGIAHFAIHPNTGSEPRADFIGLVASAVVIAALAVMAGLYIGARRELIANLRTQLMTTEREQMLRVAQARVSERARIAREMHDVLAHRISVLAMHSGVLTYRDDLSKEEVKQAATVIQQNAREALVELRGILGVLRNTEGSDTALDSAKSAGAKEPPQPTVGDLPELARTFREAGQRVDLVLQAPYEQLDGAVSRSAYRIVQESLTNVAKHAPGQPAIVTVRGQPGERLDIEVRNPLPPNGPHADDHPSATMLELPSSGMGLIGLTERAVLTGGELRHRAEGGWFILSAWLPWTRDS